MAEKSRSSEFPFRCVPILHVTAVLAHLSTEIFLFTYHYAPSPAYIDQVLGRGRIFLCFYTLRPLRKRPWTTIPPDKSTQRQFWFIMYQTYYRCICDLCFWNTLTIYGSPAFIHRQPQWKNDRIFDQVLPNFFFARTYLWFVFIDEFWYNCTFIPF